MTLSGFLNINKPYGMTSHDVVARVRRLLRRDFQSKKVGHAGTLDPLATGVLVVCLGNATRLSEYAMNSVKQYRAEIHFGIETDTYDREGKVTRTVDASALTLAEIETALPQFIGDIEQVPPMYSAIKQGGQKLYDLARKGQTVERPARAIHIDSIEILDWQSPVLTTLITCGTGTYIRSIAYDLGQAVSVGGHLTALERVRSGAFDVASAVQLDALLEDPRWFDAVVAPREALADWPALTLTADEVSELRFGRTIPRQTDTHELVFAYDTDGECVAVLEARADQWKPHKVFPA